MDINSNQILSNSIKDWLKIHKKIIVEQKGYIELIPKNKVGNKINIRMDRYLALFSMNTKIFTEEYIDEEDTRNIDIIDIRVINIYDSVKIGGNDHKDKMIEIISLVQGGYVVLGLYEIPEKYNTPENHLSKDSYMIITFNRPIENKVRVYLTNVLIMIKGDNSRKEKEEEIYIENRISLIRSAKLGNMEFIEKKENKEHQKSYV